MYSILLDILVMEHKFEIELFIDKNGNTPFIDWLEGVREVCKKAEL